MAKELEVYKDKNVALKVKITKSSKSIIEYIKAGIVASDGNYARIKKRMDTIYQFIKASKACGEEFDFSPILEAYQDFFVGSDKIRKAEFSKGEDFSALYEKQGDEKRRFWSKRGVAVLKEGENKGQILYFGQRKSWVDKLRKDTGILFQSEGVIFHHEGMNRYDEIPLWGSGLHADFHFDEQDRLTLVALQDMWEPRLGFWRKPKYINFDCGYFLLKENYEGSLLEKHEGELPELS